MLTCGPGSVQYFTFSLDKKVFASNRTEEQSEHAEFDHFCNQSDLLALSVSVLCSAVSCFSFNNEKYFENKI